MSDETEEMKEIKWRKRLVNRTLRGVFHETSLPERRIYMRCFYLANTF